MIILALLLLAVFFRKDGPSPQSPVRPHPVKYAYYQIVDAATGKTLTFVSVPVTKGDEYVTADNRRYVVVRIRENKAYARYTGMAPQNSGN